MSQHSWKDEGGHGGHNGEYYWVCTVCGMRDWLASYGVATPDWHSDEPCVPKATKITVVPPAPKKKKLKARVKPPATEWQAHQRDQVAADWLLEHGYTPKRVQLLLRSEELLAAFSEIRPLCVQCGEPGTRQFSTEGDGNYWLCDNLDTAHGIDMYAGETIPQPALRIWLGTPEPEWCDCVDEGQADQNCRTCVGVGWYLPKDDEPA